MAKKNKILIIEDNQDVLEVIINILEYYGHSVVGYNRFTEEIFERTKTESLSLIILDVMLSGFDGRDIARRFRESEETRHIPILMISAYPFVEKSVREAGATDFLQKPFSIDELTGKVDRYLQDTC
jgi:DNA-binding response OmpR family regulator